MTRPTMNQAAHVDVVVIGAGIVGASCAWQLSAARLSMMVLEARSGYAEGSTGRSFASVRAQWTDDLSISLSWNSVQRYRRFEQDHGIDIGYRPTGYLLLYPDDAWASQLSQAATVPWCPRGGAGHPGGATDHPLPG